MELIIFTYFPPMQTIKLEGEVKLSGHCAPSPMHSPNKHAHKVEEGSLANIIGRMVGSIEGALTYDFLLLSAHVMLTITNQVDQLSPTQGSQQVVMIVENTNNLKDVLQHTKRKALILRTIVGQL